MTTKDPIAVVQAAVDLTQAAREADSLLTEINEGDKALGDRRLALGRILLSVRKQFPERGPRAKGWGDFVAARKLEQRTARRYLALAEHYERHPDESRPIAEVYATFWGKEISDSLSETYPAQVAAPGPQLFAAQHALAPAEKAPPKAQPQSLPAANLPPSTNAVDRWQRFLKGELTGPEALDRKRNWTEAHQESDARIRQEYSAACKAARSAGKTVPPFPPMPGYWLTAGASNDPVQAAAKALSAAEALGREDASRKSPRMIGEVVSKLRQGSHLIPSGQDQAVYRAYCEARTAAVSRAAVEDTKTMPLPFEAAPPPPAPAPRPFVPVMTSESESDDDGESDDADDFDADDDRDLTPADDDREDEDELREVADELDAERSRLAAELTRVRAESESQLAALVEARRERDEAQRDSELAAKAHAQAIKTMEGMERELDELRTKLAGAKFVEQVRDALADEVRRLREEAGACGLVTCEADADDGDPCGRLAPPCPDGPALCQRHRQAVKLLREDAGEAGLVVCEHDDGEGGCDRICAPNPEGEALCPAHRAALEEAAAAPLLKPKGKRAKAAPGPWQPASVGGAATVHAVPPPDGTGAVPALCKQRPSYRGKGWTSRPGTPLTCHGCIAATATSKETK